MTYSEVIWLGAISRIRPPRRGHWSDWLWVASRYVLILIGGLATGVMLGWLLELQSKGMS